MNEGMIARRLVCPNRPCMDAAVVSVRDSWVVSGRSVRVALLLAILPTAGDVSPRAVCVVRDE